MPSNRFERSAVLHEGRAGLCRAAPRPSGKFDRLQQEMTRMTTAVAQPRTALNIGLWAAQILLACLYGFVGFTKLTQPIPALAAMMVWPGLAPEWFVRFVGAAELAGAIGLIAPMLTRIQPRLTPIAAAGLVLLQICAVAYHVTRGEFAVLPLNAVLLGLAAFVVWGRRNLA
jgi:hypothetical protein